ncbi:hypothetical protein FOA43_003285 [Brettanomyces nanus]|uniref:RRM domain-containing protein n=1 Tax=Eeniella nana TaxID=13502 RepID=A0A875S879_EENNA|nr:uncharacterized protein FOA43_003285 [Brettanomyces nanus]QPG75899.1 hypothetical protein FOA43_003285 [Brettanomyces nanus]
MSKKSELKRSNKSKKGEKKVEEKAAKELKEKKEESSSESESDSSSESESESDSKPESVKSESESESESESDKSDSESEAEKVAEKKETSESESASDSESDKEDTESTDSKKRKSDDEEAEPATKKVKAKSSDDSEPATVFVGRLSWNVEDDALKEFFETKCEGVVSARVLTDRSTGRSKGFGYVDFDDKEHAEKAIQDLQGSEIDGRAVNLDMATSRPRNGSSNDRANDRAKRYGDAPSEPSDTLFVGNLSFEATYDDVRGAFEAVGSVVGIRIPTHPGTEDPRGFAYVQFGSAEEAKGAMEKLNGENINGRAIRLDYSTPKPQGNSSFGRSSRGGRGGRGGRERGSWGGRDGGRDGGRERRPAASGANSVPVHFKGSKKTFD